MCMYIYINIFFLNDIERDRQNTYFKTIAMYIYIYILKKYISIYIHTHIYIYMYTSEYIIHYEITFL